MRLREPNRFNTVDLIYSKVGASAYRGGHYQSDWVSESYAPDAGGRVVIAGLSPSGAVTVEAIDATERILAQKVVTIPRETWQSVELVVGSKPKRVQGIVADPEGRPLGDVSIALVLDFETPVHQRRRGDLTRMVRSDAGGRFEFPEVHASRICIQASKPGFMPHAGVPLDVPAEGRDVSIVLERGTELTLLVSFDDGRPVSGLSSEDLRATFPDLPLIFGRETRAGVYVFGEAPPKAGKVSVTFRHGFWRFEQDWDPALGDGPVKLVIPAPGTVAATWEAPPSGPLVRHNVRLRKVGSPEVQIMSSARPRDARSGTMTFQDVLPGDYTAVLEKVEERSFEVLAGPVSLTVSSNQTATIALRP